MRKKIIMGIMTMALATNLLGCGFVHITFGSEDKKSETTSDAKSKDDAYNEAMAKAADDAMNKAIDEDNLTGDSKSNGVNATQLVTVYVPENGTTFMIPSIAKMKDKYNAEDVVKKVIELSNGAFDKQSKVLDVH